MPSLPENGQTLPSRSSARRARDEPQRRLNHWHSRARTLRTVDALIIRMRPGHHYDARIRRSLIDAGRGKGAPIGKYLVGRREQPWRKWQQFREPDSGSIGTGGRGDNIPGPGSCDSRPECQAETESFHRALDGKRPGLLQAKPSFRFGISRQNRSRGPKPGEIRRRQPWVATDLSSSGCTRHCGLLPHLRAASL